MLLLFLEFSILTYSTIGIGENSFIPNSNNGILYVGGSGPNNYTSINIAIDAANNGNTIFVYNGTYCENIIIDKSINLIGEEKNTTVIDGKRIGNTIHIKTEDVVVSGFTITNSSGDSWFHAGVRISASNNTIYGNSINNNNLGVFCKKVTNITLYNNTFVGDSITFSLYDNDTEPVPFCEKYFIHSVFNNTVNGKKIYYILNQKDFIVPEDAGQIIAVNCSNLTIKYLNLSNADYGCILVSCSDCLIEHTNISFGDGMLWIINSKNNLVQYNYISHNFEGICIDGGSTKNVIRYNVISNNEIFEIILEDGSNYNTICKNNFIKDNPNNDYQVYFLWCSRNRWYRNYWYRPRIMPKLIFGNRIIGRATIPWFNIDFRPTLKPYVIG